MAQPRHESTERDGGKDALVLEYDGFAAAFMRNAGTTEPFRLFAFNFGAGPAEWQRLGDKGLAGPLEDTGADMGKLPPAPIAAAEAVKQLPKIDRKPQLRHGR